MARRSDPGTGGPRSRGTGGSPVNSKSSHFITASQVARLLSSATAIGTESRTTLPSFNLGPIVGVRMDVFFSQLPPAGGKSNCWIAILCLCAACCASTSVHMQTASIHPREKKRRFWKRRSERTSARLKLFPIGHRVKIEATYRCWTQKKKTWDGIRFLSFWATLYTLHFWTEKATWVNS